MRVLFAALALCLSATCAMAYSAVATGQVQDGLVFGYKADAPTLREAEQAAIAACQKAAADTRQVIARSCDLFDAAGHGCFALQATRSTNYIASGHGFSIDEARSVAKTKCEAGAPGKSCIEALTFCESGVVTWTAHILSAPSEVTGTVQSWWDSAPKFYLASAAFVVLIAAFAISLFKIRQLQRALIKGGSPPSPESSPPPHAAKPDLVAQLGEALAQEPVLPPVAEPTGLDTSAIKQALRTKRKEFDL
jgi:hypothetical protein